MTEEMKRPISNITQDSIKPLLSNAVEFYTNKNREAHKCIQERDEYINYLESKLSNAKQQQALPVVPDFVAEWIECVKEKNNNALALLDDDNMPDDVNEWLFFQRNDDNIKLILRAWLDGYTVEKPQLFYLVNTLTRQYLYRRDKVSFGEQGYCKDYDDKPLAYCLFTKQEIDSMQTGSYEQIEVEE